MHLDFAARNIMNFFESVRSDVRSRNIIPKTHGKVVSGVCARARYCRQRLHKHINALSK